MTTNLTPKNIKELLDRSISYIQKENYMEALSIIERVSANVGVYNGFSFPYICVRNEFELNQYTSAEQQDNFNIQCADLVFILRLKAKCHIGLHQYQQAQNMLTNALKINKYNIDVRLDYMNLLIKEYKEDNNYNDLEPSQIKTLKELLNETYQYVYMPNEFVKYLCMHALILKEEHEYMLANYVYQHAYNIAKVLDIDTKEIKDEFTYLGVILDYPNIIDPEELVSILKHYNINYREHPDMKYKFKQYIGKVLHEEQSFELIKNVSSFYDLLFGEYEVRIASIKFYYAQRGYDYICAIEDMRE